MFSDEDNKESGSNLVSSFRAMSVDNIQQLNDHEERRQKFQSEKSINISFMSNATSMNTLSIVIFFITSEVLFNTP